jgi:hypothetical protein
MKLKEHKESLQKYLDESKSLHQPLTPEQKLIIGTSLLPVLADFIEDYPMKQLAKAQHTVVV